MHARESQVRANEYEKHSQFKAEIQRLSNQEKKYAQELLASFTEGIIEVVEEQRHRKLLPEEYKIPKILLGILPNGVATYRSRKNIIVIDMAFFTRLLKYPKDEILTGKTRDKQSIKLKATAQDFLRRIANEEAKHSIDFQAGKLDLSKAVIDNSLEYDAQQHEYVALGEKVLLAKRKDPNSSETQSLMEWLKKVIAYRREKKQKTEEKPVSP